MIVQFGGQTPLNLATGLQKAGVPIIGTSPESIDRAEDRDLFQAMMNKLGLRQPENGIAHSYEEALAVARDIGYPVMVRPSFVLGRRAMKIVYDEADLKRFSSWPSRHLRTSGAYRQIPGRGVRAGCGCDSDGENTVIGGMMEHIEEAGIHSGDSACVLPPYSIAPHHIEEMADAAGPLQRNSRSKD